MPITRQRGEEHPAQAYTRQKPTPITELNAIKSNNMETRNISLMHSGWRTHHVHIGRAAVERVIVIDVEDDPATFIYARCDHLEH